MQVAVDLDAADLDALREIAANDQLTLGDVVTLAVRNYVARRRMDDEEWKRRWDKAITAIRSGVPAGVTPEEIEADVRAARAEYREQRRAHGR
jgi:hypothetical protein